MGDLVRRCRVVMSGGPVPGPVAAVRRGDRPGPRRVRERAPGGLDLRGGRPDDDHHDRRRARPPGPALARRRRAGPALPAGAHRRPRGARRRRGRRVHRLAALRAPAGGVAAARGPRPRAAGLARPARPSRGQGARLRPAGPRARTEPGRAGSTTRRRGRWCSSCATSDRIGLLHRVAAVLEEQELDVRWARVSTLGSSVLDAFCLETAEHQGLDTGAPPQGRGGRAGRRRDRALDPALDPRAARGLSPTSAGSGRTVTSRRLGL